MLEFIIMCALGFLVTYLFCIAFQYYENKRPLKESVEHGLYMGTFLTAGITAFQYGADYQLIVIGTALGITMFLLTVVFKYHVHNRPLKDSIKRGLIVGIGYVILIILIRPTMGFYLI